MQRNVPRIAIDARRQPRAAGASAVAGAVSGHGVLVVATIVSVALYLLLFQATSKWSLVAQFASIGLLAGAALLAYLTVDAPRRSATRLELALLAITLMSGVASTLSSNSYSAGFTALFALAVLSLAVLVRALDTVTLLHSAACAFAAMALTVAVIYSAELRTALNDGSEARWSLRLKPFGIHPNLTGFIFGGGMILCVHAAVSQTGWRRYVFLASIPLCAVMPIAASHRSTIVALSASSLILGVLFAHKLQGRARRRAIGGVFAAAIVAVVFSRRIVNYIWTVFELGTTARGVGSGATGRVGVWEKTLELALGDRGTIFTGLGLRGARFEDIGSQTENSYITILLESGIVLGGIYILLMLRSTYLSGVRAWQAPRRATVHHLAIAWILLFAVIESFFNRYLLAIGNPISLVILMVVMQAALLERQGRQPRPGAVPKRVTRPPIRRARRVVREPDAVLAPAE